MADVTQHRNTAMNTLLDTIAGFAIIFGGAYLIGVASMFGG